MSTEIARLERNQQRIDAMEEKVQILCDRKLLILMSSLSLKVGINCVRIEGGNGRSRECGVAHSGTLADLLDDACTKLLNGYCESLPIRTCWIRTRTAFSPRKS